RAGCRSLGQGPGAVSSGDAPWFSAQRPHRLGAGRHGPRRASVVRGPRAARFGAQGRAALEERRLATASSVLAGGGRGVPLPAAPRALAGADSRLSEAWSADPFSGRGSGARSP